MADDNVKMSDQFRWLDMAELIGGPLKAACSAQMMLASSTKKFIEDVGLEAPNGNEERKNRTIEFSFIRAATDEDEKERVPEEVSIEVPVLSIVKIPTLAVDEIDISFDMEVKSSATSESSKDSEGVMDRDAGIKGGPFGANVKIHGSVACHESDTRSSDNSAKYHIQVHAKDSDMPEGLSKMIEILSTASESNDIEGKAEGAGERSPNNSK